MADLFSHQVTFVPSLKLPCPRIGFKNENILILILMIDTETTYNFKLFYKCILPVPFTLA